MLNAVPPYAGNCLSLFCDGQLRAQLNTVTFNALSLVDPGPAMRTTAHLPAAGFRMLGNQEVLKRQLNELEVHVAGFQETRLQDDQEAVTTVALWLHKRRPLLWLNGKPVRIGRDHLTVVSASPRLLIVAISEPAFPCVLVVAHAPHDPKPGQDEDASAWNTVRAGLLKFPPHMPFIVLADANAHLGGEPTSAVGDLDPDPENGAGRAFHSFMLDLDLLAANTFRSCHSGPSPTWRSPQGGLRRLDYVSATAAYRSLPFVGLLFSFEGHCSRDLPEATYQKGHAAHNRLAY